MADDLSQMSTEDLLRMYQGAPASGGDMSSRSTEDLLRIYQGTTEPKREMQGPLDQRPFLERAASKLGSFFRNVYENPPPSVAAIGRTIREAPGAATELTWGADPDAARQAAGTIAGAASLGLPLAPGLRAGEGVFAAPLGTAAQRAAPVMPSAAAAVTTPAEASGAAAGRLGVQLPYYLTTEGEAIPRVAQAVKEAPWSGAPVVESAQKVLEDLGAAKAGLVTGAGTPELGGAAAKRAVQDWITTGSQVPVSKAYSEIDKLIDPEKMRWLTNTGETVKNIIAERANARIPGTSRAADQVLTALQSPMDYEGIKRLRSYIGEQTPEQLVAGGINPTENKRIYAALTNDLRDVISFAGGDEALGKWQEANALARLTNMQRNLLTKVIGSKGEVAPEQVFSRLMSYAGSKSTADINRLRLVRSTVGPDAWNELSGALINRLGADAAGKFSADRFVTAFNNLSPAAKGAMFDANQLAALNDLFTVSRHIQERVTRLSNPSGTGRTVFTLAMGAAMMAEPISTISKLVGGRLLANALSHPVIAKAATDAARAQLAGDRIAFQAALDRLRLAAGRAGLLSAASTLQQNLRPVSQQQP